MVSIEADTIHLDGTISANEPGGANGHGSGGSILIKTVVLQGSGQISANGGNAGGGGGRIAIYYEDISGFDITRISAFGGYEHGYGYSHGGTGGNWLANGGAGTIYLKQTGQVYGDLIVSDNIRDRLRRT